MVAWPLTFTVRDNKAMVTGIQVSFLMNSDSLIPDRVLSGLIPCPGSYGRQRCYFSTFYQRIRHLLRIKIPGGGDNFAGSGRSCVPFHPGFRPARPTGSIPSYPFPPYRWNAQPGVSTGGSL